MADEVNENIFLVNAPAGSGKTTWIRQQVESYLLRNPKDNILCITYTNRAAEELGRDLEQSRVYFGTIHSFINDFIGSFFSHKEIIDLYWEVYETQIIERIKNTEQKETWTEGAERYKEKYGSLDLDTVRSNINKISYNETPFNSLLYGGLGHNDLITFTKLAVDRFPIIKKKISDKYQLIFIDEYQDTSAEVLHIFYTSLVGKKSKLYLLGDKMQQIYKNYNGEFEEKLETFNRSVNLSINYRTTPKIVDILNYIYNDEALKQCPYEKNSNDTMAFSPKVLIVSDVEKAISDFRKTYEDALLLYVSNRARFYDIGAGNLYDAYNKMEKYQFWKKYSAVDVMTKDEARINDALLSFLFIVDQIIEYYLQECYGEVFRNIHEYYMYFNSEKYIVEKHRDKKTIKTRLEKIKNSYVDRATTIDGFLNICFKEEFIEEEIYCSIIEDDDYQLVKDVYIEEVRKLTNYLNDPRVSTQHGVKGESHDTVVFVADNSSNPAVHMSKFFEVWSEMNITLSKMPYFIPVSGEYDNSLELRGNLVKSLCWVKKNLSELSQCNQEKIENNIYTLVSTLLQDAKWITWTSLRDCLQNLAELSPEAFLKEAERGIINNPTEIVNLFPPKSGELSGINYISNLLWALEILAWSPEYLVHSISVLGLLEALPYERTNWTNTPINSIVSILLPWYPQTMADLEKRKNALKCLKTDNPRVFWSTLKKLLPNKTRSTSGNPRPKYLKLEIPEEVKVTNAEAHECYVYLVELAVDTARNENEKLVELIDQLGYMYEPTLTDYLECLENSFEFGTDENTFEVWLKLRECMARIEPTEGKVIYKHLDRIQQLIEKMEPTDIRVKHREWYLGNRYLFDKGNYANRWKMLEDKKLSAVKEIFDEYGSEEVERFGSAVKNVHDVANKLGHFLKPKEMSSIIEKCFIGILSKEFTINCLISFVYTQGAEKLLETSLCQMEDEFMLEILSKIPFSLQLLDVINQVLDDDTAYWEKGAMPYSCYDAEELKIIVEKLVVCKRYVTGIMVKNNIELKCIE